MIADRPAVPLCQGEGMRSAEMLVWMGDFNYRVDMEYDPAVRAVQRLAAGDREALTAMLKKVRPPSRGTSCRLGQMPHAPPWRIILLLLPLPLLMFF